jgi:hypothetical protein
VSKHNPNRSDAKPDGAKKNDLSLEDTVAQKVRGLSPQIKSGVCGYNPYDAAISKPAVGDPPKATDLRKLSEWIRLTRQVAALKKDKPD